MNGMTFSNRIRNLLKEKKISQNNFLKDIGIAKASLTNWEQRGSIPSADIVFKIAKYFNVSMEYLLTGENTGDEHYKYIESIPEERQKNITFSIPETDPEKIREEDERILVNNYRFLTPQNKKMVQYIINTFLMNQ